MTTFSTAIVFTVAVVAVFARFGHETAMVAGSVGVIAWITYGTIRRKARR